MLKTKSKLALMALTASGLAVGLLVDIAFARTAGASTVTDSLVIALTIPFVIDTVLREGTRYSIISIIHDRELVDVESEIVALAIGAFSITFLLTAVIFEWPLANIKALHESSLTTVFAATASGLFAYAAFLSATADANNYFLLSSSRNIIVHLTALGAFLALHLWANAGVLTAALLAYLLGSFAYAAVLTTILTATGVLASVKVPTAASLHGFRRKFIPSLVNVGAGQGMRVAERGFLIPLAGGGVFLFYIAFRIFASLQALIGGTLAALAMRKNKDLVIDLNGFRTALLRAAAQCSIYAVPCVVVITLFGQEIIKAAYGKKLTDTDILIVYEVARLLSFAIYFQALNVIVTTFWLGRQRTFLMNVAPISVLLFSIPAYGYFSIKLGVIGVGYVTTAAVVASLVINLVLLLIQIKKEHIR